MDSGLLLSSPNASSLTTGGKVWGSKHSKNVYSASSYASKASKHIRKSQLKYNLVQQSSLNHHQKRIEGLYTSQECNRKYVVQATSKSSFDSEPQAFDSQNMLDSVKNFLDTLYKFIYPYAIIGEILFAISSSLLTVQTLSDISPSFFVGVLQGVIPQLLMGVYVGAINQVFDLQIDKINKPYLPLASGKISFKTVVIIAASSVTLSFGLSWIIGSWSLIWNVVLMASIWTGYSINGPFLRWKRNPFLSAMCMVATIAYLFPITLFIHMQTFVLKRPFIFSRSLICVVAFLSFYSMGMALAKDISDVEGDKAFGVDTFAVRWGQKRVFWICIFLFELAFGVSLLGGATSPFLWVKIVTGVGNIVLGSILWYQAKSIDLSSKESGRSFYMLIWKLLYAAYFLAVLIR